jgi:two-component system invasion response regulator UvrY
VIRVVIADDHPVVRTGLRHIAALGPEIEVVAEATTGEEALLQVAQTGAHVLLTDMMMPGPGIFPLLTCIRAAHPGVRVLVLSVHPESEYALRLLRAGAAGYLNKDRSPEELVEAIRRVHAGRRYISVELAEELVDRISVEPVGAPHELLSNREFDVLCRLGAGLSVTEIADALGLSAKTVSTYRARLWEKMQFRTNADVVRYVTSRGLLPKSV